MDRAVLTDSIRTNMTLALAVPAETQEGKALEPVRPGAIIGIIGDGYLSHLLAFTASRLGMMPRLFARSEPTDRALDLLPTVRASYGDAAALAAFCGGCDIVTSLVEDLSLEPSRCIEAGRSIYPHPYEAVVVQNRIAERRFLEMNDVPVAPYKAVDDLDSLQRALAQLDYPAVLKTASKSRSGTGQRIIRNSSEAVSAFAALAGQQLVVESFVPAVQEISVVVARNFRGHLRDFDVAQNVYRDGRLWKTRVPAQIPAILARQASRIACQIAGALDHIGVMAVEFFMVQGPSRPFLIVNEVTLGVHAAGNWTEAACVTNQFEQHIRAICHWPLGDPARLADVETEHFWNIGIADLVEPMEGRVRPSFYAPVRMPGNGHSGHLNRVVPRSQ